MNSNNASTLFSADGSQWRSHDAPLSWPDTPDERITKIVVGTEPTVGQERADVTLLESLPHDLARRFPNLTHLHLWQVAGLKSLPALPDRLRCLDVRGCAELVELPELKVSLETLIVGDCPHATLKLRTHRVQFPALTELAVRGSARIEEAWIHAALQGSPLLRWFDASHCPQLTFLPDWPPQLVDARLDGCEWLTALPSHWPPDLRRIGLRGATRITEVPDFHPPLDYVDLAHTESLRALPDDRGQPRSLFLFGSGVLVPPASEHGKSADENVASSTEAYFEDVELTGRGEVKRCKLLMLGNGGAGKTCLSQALVPGGDPALAEKLGSTHGIQFWDWDFRAKVAGRVEPIHLHLWDFGGQEIYHNTHRLFMSKGAVFIVVWYPEQDQKRPEPSDNEYQDEWRPLQYWIDFIHLACPHKPRILIVCSHHAKRTETLEAKWRGQVRPEFHDQCKCFYVDSRERAGELEQLKKELVEQVGQVVSTQGVAVPSYWEIAQNMTEEWVRCMKGDAAFAAAHNEMPPETFCERLGTAIGTAIANDKSRRYAKLAASAASGVFSLTDDRLRRTLSFLTHSGWVYWDPKLFEGRVIIGQQWALDGLYAVLDRRASSSIYRALSRRAGRFTLSDLGQWVWNKKGYSPDEQLLLLTFMKLCGLCFRLRPGAEAWREEDVYVSFEHLPKAEELGLEETFRSRRPKRTALDDRLEEPRLHKQHWQAFLTAAGNHYGKDARYALDGFYLENPEEGEKLLVLCHLAQEGLGGAIEIRVGGKNAAERLKSVTEYVKQFLPTNEGKEPSAPAQSLPKPAAVMEVFISYAWDPLENDGETGIPPGYEAPVDAIERFLQDKPVELIRDKNVNDFGADLLAFMQNGAKCPHVIVVHSDKYWRSAFCLFELSTVMDELGKWTDRHLMSVVIPVEHRASDITRREGLEAYLKYWKKFSNTPGLLPWTPEELKDYARSLLRKVSRDFSNHLSLNLKWSEGEPKVLAEIAKRLGLTGRPRGQ